MKIYYNIISDNVFDVIIIVFNILYRVLPIASCYAEGKPLSKEFL